MRWWEVVGGGRYVVGGGQMMGTITNIYLGNLGSRVE